MHSVPHHSLDIAASALVCSSAFMPPVRIPPQQWLHSLPFTMSEIYPAISSEGAPDCGRPHSARSACRRPGFHDDDGYALLCGPLAETPRSHARRTAAVEPVCVAARGYGHNGRPPKQFERPRSRSAVACERLHRRGERRSWPRRSDAIDPPSPAKPRSGGSRSSGVVSCGSRRCRRLARLRHTLVQADRRRRAHRTAAVLGKIALAGAAGCSRCAVVAITGLVENRFGFGVPEIAAAQPLQILGRKRSASPEVLRFSQLRMQPARERRKRRWSWRIV